MSQKTVKIPSMTRVLDIAPESIDEEKRTVEVIWTTGARAKQWSWELGGFTEELEISEKAVNMERLASGNAPFLNMHDGWSLSAILGVVESAWIVEGKEGRAIIRFAKDDENVDKVWNLIKQRIIRNISVGYTVEEYEKYEENGEIIYRAVKWTPLELSAVTVPADANATIRAKEPRFGDCLITTRSLTKEKIMKKRSARENEEDIDINADADENARIDEEGQDPEKDDVPAEREGNEETPKKDEETGSDPAARSAKASVSRRDFIYGLCEAAGLSITQARRFDESKKTTSEVRSEILKMKSSEFENISNARNVSAKSTKTLSQRAAEVYCKKE